ncbi:MAG: ribonuclease III [Candidatus Aminicenantes bacterium]|nr:ribonuclease III [Candidatus Aminicenantes bacterium]MDH5714052.1 ribonuclease III [Candidatus Aminicenantes bacterium]
MAYQFQKKEFLLRALTHRSYANEHPESVHGDNELLEFLGDAILGFITSELLLSVFPNSSEGELTKMKAFIVCTECLAQQAHKLGLGDYLLLSHGEEKSMGREKESLLADAYEALTAAIYLDGGLEAAREFVQNSLADRLSRIGELAVPGNDYKSSFQEYVQAQDLPLPNYTVVEEWGPQHRKHFVVELRIGEVLISTGRGKTKKEAQQEAAKKASQIIHSIPFNDDIKQD